MKRFAMCVLPLALVACGVDDNLSVDDQAQDVDDPAGKEDGAARPVGTFRADAPEAGDLLTLVLMGDRSFHRETMIYCSKKPCDPPVEDGSYKFTKSGSSTYIRFTMAGATLDRYQYKLSGSELSLRRVGGSQWTTMMHSDEPWCAESRDCEKQGIKTTCLPQWSCAANACALECGQATNTCEAAGGACVALTDTSCEGGVVGDADKYSCGGALGVECCLPK